MNKRLITHALVVLAFLSAGCNTRTSTGPARASGKPPTVNLTIDGASLKCLVDSSSTSIRLRDDQSFSARAPLLDIVAFVAIDEIVSSDVKLPNEHYSVEISPPSSPDESRDHLRSQLNRLLQEALGLRFTSVKRERSVLLLQDLPTGRKNATVAGESGNHGYGTISKGYEFRKHTTADLARFLSNELGDFVLDNTGDVQSYNFKIPVDIFETHSQNNWKDGLSSIGLQLTNASRIVQFTVIEATSAE